MFLQFYILIALVYKLLQIGVVNERVRLNLGRLKWVRLIIWSRPCPPNLAWVKMDWVKMHQTMDHNLICPTYHKYYQSIT